jgi:hypothetical protein
MRRKIDTDNYLAPVDVEALQGAATYRQAARENWAALPESTRGRLAQDAESHLVKAARTLVSRDPQLAALDEISSRMREFHSGGLEQAAIDGLYVRLDEFDRLYLPDQLPFQIAGTVLDTCSGPWTYTKKRWFGLAAPAALEVCPQGERTQGYFLAGSTAQRLPKEPKL